MVNRKSSAVRFCLPIILLSRLRRCKYDVLESAESIPESGGKTFEFGRIRGVKRESSRIAI